jgi:chitodextrinase
LAANHVGIAFNGHAHIYERNPVTLTHTLTTYVTGGGGGALSPVGENPCSAFDAYAIGWSPSKNKGSKCGAAPVPDSATRVYHFLKVTVNGTTVTVTPTDELGRTFDVQTYDFSGIPPDTVIDSGPSGPTNATSASFAFHSTRVGATFACKLDAAAAVPCTSPVNYSGLAQGAHTFSVSATTASGTDPIPATASWTVDSTPPTQPTGLTASSPSPSLVNLNWTASTDANGVTGYTITRNGATLTSVSGTTTSYADTSVAAGTAYQYQVVARDAAGNSSAPSAVAPVTTPGATPPVFTDGFETGNLSAWTSNAGLTVQGALTHTGAFAALANTTNGNTYAKKTLPATYTDGYSRIWFNRQSSSSQVNLLRHRTAADGSLAYVFLSPTGALGLRNDIAATTLTSSTVVAPGGWHQLELHTLVNGTTSVIEVWLDGVRIDSLSTSTANLGTTPIGKVQIGEVQTGRTYNVAIDDVAFGTQRIGP